jgi:hypothetical protein
MLSTLTLRRLALLPFLLLLGAGCDPQGDDVTGTGGGGGTGSTDPQAFQEQALLTFDTANGVVSGIDAIAHGDFTQILNGFGFPVGPARAADDFIWDAQQGAWILDTQGVETDSTGATATYDIWVWIQFRDGAGTPQSEPDETTAILTFDMDWVITLDAEDNGETISMDMAYASELDVSGLPDGPYSVDGTGTMGVDLFWHSGGDFIDISFAMGWDMDLQVPSNDGCPSGQMSVWADEYRATATYDGSTTYSWVMTEHGQVVAGGTETIACGVLASGTTPVSAWDRWSALKP